MVPAAEIELGGHHHTLRTDKGLAYLDISYVYRIAVEMIPTHLKIVIILAVYCYQESLGKNL